MGKWKTVRLGDVCTFINGDRGKNYPSSSDFANDGIPFINAGHLCNNQISFTKMNYISEEKYRKLNSGKIQDGDILYCLRGSLGKHALVDHIENGAVASSLVIIRPQSINVRFLHYALDTELILQQMHHANNGSSQPNLSAANVKQFAIPLPPLDVQQKIADVLDKASALITLRRAQLDKLDLLIKSKFIEMFGDPVRNPMGFEVHQLSEYIQFLTSGSRGWAQYFSSEGEFFITIKNVKNCRITLDDVQHISPPDNAEAARTRVREGDLLISITADLGRTGVVTKDIADYGAYINQHLTCIRLDKSALNPLYVAYFMESPAGKEQFEAKNQSAVKAGLNFNSINTLKLLVPSLALQSQFVSFVEQVDKSKFAIQQSLSQLEQNYNSLMQKCFRGEIF